MHTCNDVVKQVKIGIVFKKNGFREILRPGNLFFSTLADSIALVT